jgi:hypothetical protein
MGITTLFRRMDMEIVGLISAIIGLITAIVKRKTIIELRYSYSETSSQPVTIGKRFKRLIILAVVGFISTGIGGMVFKDAGAGIVLEVFGVLCLYQAMAIVILMFASLWK